MLQSQVRIGRYYVHEYFGVLKVVGRWLEGSGSDKHYVYDCSKKGVPTNYNCVAGELERTASRDEWEANNPAGRV